MAKVDRPWEFRPPFRVGPHRNCSSTNHFRSLGERRLGGLPITPRAQLHADGGAPNEHFDIWRGLAGYSSIVQCTG
jgi:hypothetical protein